MSCGSCLARVRIDHRRDHRIEIPPFCWNYSEIYSICHKSLFLSLKLSRNASIIRYIYILAQLICKLEWCPINIFYIHICNILIAKKICEIRSHIWPKSPKTCQIVDSLLNRRVLQGKVLMEFKIHFLSKWNIKTQLSSICFPDLVQFKFPRAVQPEQV